MKKIILLVLFNVSFICPVFTQHLTPLQEDVVRTTMSAQFADVGKTRVLNLGKDVFCVVGNDTLFNPDGYNYVFKLHHDSVIRLDRSLYHGSNHRRFLFAHNGELCALGGYGFFTTNNNLQVFNPNVKEWLFKTTAGSVPDYICGLCFKKGDEVYSLNNFKSGNGSAQNKVDSCIYKLNLKTMIWEQFYQINYPSKFFGIAFYTDYYNLILSDLQTIIVKPSELKFLLLDNEVLGFVSVTTIDSICDDFVYFSSTSSSSEINKQHVKLDLNATWKKYADKSKPFDLKTIKKGETKSFDSWFIISFLLLLIIIVGYFVKRRFQAKSKYAVRDTIHPDMIEENPIQTQTVLQSETLTESLHTTQTEIEDEITEDSEEENHAEIEEDLSDSLYNTLLNSEKTFFNGDELDEIFGIAHLEPDSKKSKRHRYLANLDKNHPGFVVRIREQIDKRRFNYKIVK